VKKCKSGGDIDRPFSLFHFFTFSLILFDVFALAAISVDSPSANEVALFGSV
jgi:hypothetical protein